jgi:hypothetical protein
MFDMNVQSKVNRFKLVAHASRSNRMRALFWDDSTSRPLFYCIDFDNREQFDLFAGAVNNAYNQLKLNECWRPEIFDDNGLPKYPISR